MVKKDVAELTIKPAIDFINKIKETDRVVIACGHDNDSICSAAVISKLFQKIKKVQFGVFITKDNFALTKEDMEDISKMEPTHVIVLDIAHIESSNELAKYKSLIIDHHQPLKLSDVTYCNPREFEKKIYMPVSYLVFKIYEKFDNPSEIIWIAAVGVLADHAVSIADDLFGLIKEKEPQLIGETKIKDEDLFSHSYLGNLAKVFDSARVMKGRDGSKLAVRFLIQSRSYEDLKNEKNEDAEKLLSWSEAVQKEFKRLVADFNKKKKLIKGKIIFYEIPSKLSMKSSLSGYLAQFYKDKILVIAQKFGKNLDISFRRGEKIKIDLNKMAKKAVTGIPNADGGGHEAAAGARIPVKYIAKFLKQL